jgi:hypothetical protein
MRSLFEVPWLAPSRRTLFGFAALVILVFSLFALLKVNTSGKQPPAKELVTGSIQRAQAVRESPSKDPMAAFLVPASTVQITLPKRGTVPLPRPRPKSL